MDLAVNARMSEYYERFIELQEKLRKSEEERMKLEMKFNDMMQKTREEEQVYYRKLRSQYKKFLDEDRKRQERNEKIIRTLERIEVRIDMLTSKTERFKSLRRQYQNYLKNVSSSQETIRVDSTRYKSLPKETPRNDELLQTDQKLNDDKMEILDRYLESISSQRCKEIIEKRKLENAQLEKLDVLKDRLHNNSFDSNKAQTIAEDIMNSIYNRHYNKDQSGVTNNKLSFEHNDAMKSSDDDDYSPQHSRFEKADVQERTQEVTKLDKEISNYRNGNDKIENDTSEKEKRVFVEDSHELRYVRKQPEDVPEQKRPDNDKQLDKLDETINNDFHTQSALPKKNRAITNETDDFVEIKNVTCVDDTIIEAHLENYDSNKDVDKEKSNLDLQQENDPIISNNNQVKEIENPSITEETNEKINEESTVENSPSGGQEMLNEPISYEEKPKPIQSDDIDRINQPTEDGQSNQYDQTTNENQSDQSAKALGYDATAQPIQYDEKGQPIRYDERESNIQYDENGQPIQYEANSQQIQYDGNNQPIQYDQNGQLIQYDGNNQQIQYDENGQPIQYDENGQPIQYDENGQPIQYDENGQPIQYDENDQLIQYDGNNQQIQYDENGQPIQYDENGQQIQYDENGQPFQYDENGRPIYFDETGQRIQYDESGQPIRYDPSRQPIEYDGNGQAIQYDENGQPIQYDENGQPIHYDGNGQAIQYDGNGQPIQYDGNGQPIQYDGSGQPIQYDENRQAIQYDENGRPVYYPQYDENGQIIQDSGEVKLDESKPVLDGDNEPFGEKILEPTEAAEEKAEFKGDDEIQPKTNNILEMLDTDTESLQQNVSKVSNDSDFTVSS